jgi:hypothetical protein
MVSNASSILARIEGDKLFLGFAVHTSEDQVGGVRVGLSDQLPKLGQFRDDGIYRVVTIEIGVQDELRGVSDLDEMRENCLADKVVVHRVDAFRFGGAGIAKNQGFS